MFEEVVIYAFMCFACVNFIHVTFLQILITYLGNEVASCLGIRERRPNHDIYDICTFKMTILTDTYI